MWHHQLSNSELSRKLYVTCRRLQKRSLFAFTERSQGSHPIEKWIFFCCQILKLKSSDKTILMHRTERQENNSKFTRTNAICLQNISRFVRVNVKEGKNGFESWASREKKWISCRWRKWRAFNLKLIEFRKKEKKFLFQFFFSVSVSVSGTI